MKSPFLLSFLQTNKVFVAMTIILTAMNESFLTVVDAWSLPTRVSSFSGTALQTSVSASFHKNNNDLVMYDHRGDPPSNKNNHKNKRTRTRTKACTRTSESENTRNSKNAKREQRTWTGARSRARRSARTIIKARAGAWIRTRMRMIRREKEKVQEQSPSTRREARCWEHAQDQEGETKNKDKNFD